MLLFILESMATTEKVLLIAILLGFGLPILIGIIFLIAARKRKETK